MGMCVCERTLHPCTQPHHFYFCSRDSEQHPLFVFPLKLSPQHMARGGSPKHVSACVHLSLFRFALFLIFVPLIDVCCLSALCCPFISKSKSLFPPPPQQFFKGLHSAQHTQHFTARDQDSRRNRKQTNTHHDENTTVLCTFHFSTQNKNTHFQHAQKASFRFFFL